MQVVMTSELSNQVDNKGEHCVASIAGITVAHRVHRRLMLARVTDNRFAAKIIKSNVLPQTIIPFNVSSIQVFINKSFQVFYFIHFHF